MRERNLPPAVEVVWEDSTGTHGWSKDADAREIIPDLATSIGFLLEETPKLVRLSGTTVHLTEKEFARSCRFDCVTVIPKSAVRSIRQIRKARK